MPKVGEELKSITDKIDTEAIGEQLEEIDVGAATQNIQDVLGGALGGLG